MNYLTFVMHGQCDAIPTVIFPATGHHRFLTCTNLYYLVTQAHVCDLPKVITWKWNGWKLNLQPRSRKS